MLKPELQESLRLNFHKCDLNSEKIIQTDILCKRHSADGVSEELNSNRAIRAPPGNVGGIDQSDGFFGPMYVLCRGFNR